jgi:PEP-CTERM motif-containing protein
VSASITPTVGGLGMFIEPNQFAVFDVTLLLSTGATITQAVNGSGGAAFFGYTGSDVTRVTISSTDTSGFAYGDFFTTPVQAPEPASIMLLGTGLLALGGRFRRKKT